jgi:hypothetical protein
MMVNEGLQADMPLREMNEGHETATMDAHSHATEPEVIAHRRDAQSRNGGSIPPLHARSAIATASMGSDTAVTMPSKKMVD